MCKEKQLQMCVLENTITITNQLQIVSCKVHTVFLTDKVAR